tara:strand:- start:822 stop:3257 length:2436 start_codon:yes stop_codon:yes gene_type:complete
MNSINDNAINALKLDNLEDSKKLCLSIIEEGNEDAVTYNIIAIIESRIGNIESAKSYLEKAIYKYPDNHITFFNLGKILYENGEINKSIECFKKAIEINPDLDNAYENILNAQMEESKFDDAFNFINLIKKEKPNLKFIKFYEGKIHFLKNNINKAYYLIKEVLNEDANNHRALSLFAKINFVKNDTINAIKFFKKAINLQKHPDDLINLSVCLNQQGKIDEAIEYIIEANKLFPNNILLFEHWASLLVRKNSFFDACEKCYEGINKFYALPKNIQVLNEPVKKNIELKLIDIIELITITPEINYNNNENLMKKNFQFFEKIVNSDNDFDLTKIKATFQNTIKNLIINNSFHEKINDENFRDILKYKILKNYISEIINTNIEIEDFLINLRSYIIDKAVNDRYENNNDSFIDLLGAITIQCYRNEYIWKVNKIDSKNKSKILKILETIDQKDVKKIEFFILCFSSLETIKNIKNLKKFSNILKNTEDKNLSKLYEFEIINFKKEKIIKKSISTLGQIKNSTSKKVQKQYETYPYPRWDKVNKSFQENYNYIIQTEILPNKLEVNQNENEDTRILIAGCGTGRHAITTALAAQKAMVTAIDLSKESLSYGIRKADELGVSNINWFHGDLLDVKKFDYEFNYIEASGVLHHMKKPEEGFTALNSKLKNKGLMKLGFYSKYAKRRFKNVKNFIKKNKLKNNKSGIQKAREYIINSTEDNEVFIKNYISDFYITSEFIDLLFHEQEVFYEIPELRKIFDKDFSFLGFVMTDSQREFYKKKFSDDKTLTNLNNWNIIEKNNPDIFMAMYQFWLQKK